MATPNITREIFDGNLTRVTPVGVTNRRVVILGTASDGPMYTPIQVTSAGDAEDQFGSISDGTLVRGIKETMDAQAGFPKNPAVWGMRIGGIVASRASKSVYDAASNGNVLLELEAIHEGTMYNDIYMNVDSTLNEVSVWNPKLKTFTKFKYNWDDPNDTNADVHSLQELVDAINGDRNLSSIVFAATPSLEESVECFVAAGSGLLIENAIGKTKIDLGEIAAGNSQADGEAVQSGAQANGNGYNADDLTKINASRFRDVVSAYSIYVSDFETCLQNTPQHVVTDKFILNNVGIDNSVRSILNLTEDSADIVDCSTGSSQGMYHIKEKGAQVSIESGGYVDVGESVATKSTIISVQNLGEAHFI